MELEDVAEMVRTGKANRARHVADARACVAQEFLGFGQAQFVQIPVVGHAHGLVEKVGEVIGIHLQRRGHLAQGHRMAVMLVDISEHRIHSLAVMNSRDMADRFWRRCGCKRTSALREPPAFGQLVLPQPAVDGIQFMLFEPESCRRVKVVHDQLEERLGMAEGVGRERVGAGLRDGSFGSLWLFGKPLRGRGMECGGVPGDPRLHNQRQERCAKHPQARAQVRAAAVANELALVTGGVSFAEPAVGQASSAGRGWTAGCSWQTSDRGTQQVRQFATSRWRWLMPLDVKGQAGGTGKQC